MSSQMYRATFEGAIIAWPVPCLLLQVVACYSSAGFWPEALCVRIAAIRSWEGVSLRK
jgi:hypothetical protein